MRRRYLAAVIALGLVLTAGIISLVHGHSFPILNPAGHIAERERWLIIFATGLSLLVVIPVFAMAIGIAWKYRAGNIKAKYEPDWDHNPVAETIWWGIPTVLIIVLSIVTWASTHELDPTKALADSKPPLHVQVVALPWKWLFIYPDLGVASVNALPLPVNVPVQFDITSDAPMNSFWIPNLGGQMYAMSGMSTRLNLIADRVGDYPGLSANISGEGFAGMKFTAHATSQTQFDEWVKSASVSDPLDANTYQQLSKPSQNNPTHSYAISDRNLYDDVVMKYMPTMEQN